MIAHSGKEWVPVVHGRRQLLDTQVSPTLIRNCEQSRWWPFSIFFPFIFQVSLGLLPHSHIGQTLQPLNNLIAHKVGPSFLLFFTFFPFPILKLTLSRYFVDDLSDLIDCMDYGFHQSLSRAMMMRSDALKQVASMIKMLVSYRASFPDSKVRAAGYWSHGEGVGCFGLQVGDLEAKLQTLDENLWSGWTRRGSWSEMSRLSWFPRSLSTCPSGELSRLLELQMKMYFACRRDETELVQKPVLEVNLTFFPQESFFVLSCIYFLTLPLPLLCHPSCPLTTPKNLSSWTPHSLVLSGV